MTTRYHKEFARNYSLFQVFAYHEFVKRTMPEFNIELNPANPLIVHDGRPLVGIYYPQGGLAEVFAQFMTSRFDETFFDAVVRKYFEVIETITPYFQKQKAATNLDELKWLNELVLDYYYGESVIWVTPLVEGLPQAIRDRALSVRERTQELSSFRDELMDYNLARVFPALSDVTHFLSPVSVFAGKSEAELRQEAEACRRGFIYFNHQLEIGDPALLLKKHDIELEEEMKPGSVSEFTGQAAARGVARGTVKIVLTNRDIDKVLPGDVLVTPMTRPDFLPAMGRAVAFVTDEGGITCHAAIIAREMKKPCIIGTKIATQVLKDGDEVEVDAEKGIVRKV